MPAQYKLPEEVLAPLADALLGFMTPDDVLQDHVEIHSVPNIHIEARAEMKANRFILSITFGVKQSLSYATVTSRHWVTEEGIPDIKSTKYSAELQRGTKVIGGSPAKSADYIFTELVLDQTEVFRESLTIALQLCQYIEQGLKVKFES